MATPVYLERGKKRVFAGALEWPGWCRSGRDDEEAIEQLLAYGDRYAAAIARAGRTVRTPKTPKGFEIVEELVGNSTTDFGAPGIAPAADAASLTAAKLRTLIEILEASWDAFEAAATTAKGKKLRTGPRGGGRDVAKMTDHVIEGQWGYLQGLGAAWKPPGRDPRSNMASLRAAVVDALGARARGEIPDRGPRGGVRWSARYAIRRSAWHALDHAWEIEDRLT